MACIKKSRECQLLLNMLNDIQQYSFSSNVDYIVHARSKTLTMQSSVPE